MVRQQLVLSTIPRRSATIITGDALSGSTANHASTATSTAGSTDTFGRSATGITSIIANTVNSK